MEQTSTIRTFAAIKIPEELQNKLGSIQNELKTIPGRITWVAPENIHLTLKFLGEVEGRKLDKITRELNKASEVCSPFMLEFTELGAFPNLERPRVIWIGISGNEQLHRLQREVEQRLRKCGFAPESKRFSPHLTLGRIRSLKDRPMLRTAVSSVRLPELEEFRIDNIYLMRSQLRPDGPWYTKLAVIPLAG